MREIDISEFGATLPVHGIATHYHDVGEGPVVLLLHGSGPGVTAHSNWRLVLPRLSEDFRVIAPDILGFGYTEVPDDVSYDVDTWLRHVTGFIDALGIGRCAVVGNSFGGALALHLAARHPECVERLVLMGSAGVSFDLTPGLDAAWGYEPSSPDAMRNLLRSFTTRHDLVDEDLVDSRYRASLRPGVQERYSAMFPAPRQRSIDALALDEADLARVKCETLLVHGLNDQIVPVEASQRLAKQLSRARLHVIPECGHWVQIEKVDEFLAVVRRFLSEHEPVESAGTL